MKYALKKPTIIFISGISIVIHSSVHTTGAIILAYLRQRKKKDSFIKNIPKNVNILKYGQIFHYLKKVNITNMPASFLKQGSQHS